MLEPKRAYVAGGMSNLPLFGWPVFEGAATTLRGINWDIVSPTEIDVECGMVEVDRFEDGSIKDVRTTDTFDYEKILAIDFAEVSTCEAIVLLPGWTKSSGAKRELAHAISLGLEVFLYTELEEAIKNA